MDTLRKGLIVIIILLLLCTHSLAVLASSPFTSGGYVGGVPVPEFRGVSIIDSPDLRFEGKINGAQLMNNIDFVDIRNHWAEPYIVEMAAQSVIKGYGSRLFRPESPLTRQEAVALLVRTMGLEDEVQRRAETSVSASNARGIFDLWAQEYINMAFELGIATMDAGSNWKDNATRQEVAVWFANALKLQPVYGADQQYIYNLRDWQQIDPDKLAVIEAVMQEGIMKGNDRGYFNPSSHLKRADMATMLARVAEKFYASRNIEAYKGQVLQKGLREGRTILGIQNIDGTTGAIELLPGTDFPVFREGSLGTAGDIRVGDELEYLYDGKGIVFARVINDGTITSGIKSINNGRMQTYYGQITGIFTDYRKEPDGSMENVHYRVSNVDGQIYDIVYEKNLDTGAERDIAVYKDGRLTDTDALNVGDEIKYGVLNGGQALYVEVLNLQRQVIEGYVQSVNPYEARISLIDYEGRLHSFKYIENPGVIINQRPADITDLKYGQEVVLTVTGGLVTRADSNYYIEQPGHIPNEGQTRSGRVKFVDSESIVLELENGIEREFKITPNTLITKEGRNVYPGSIRIGDAVQVYVDTLDSSIASRIKVQGLQQLIKDVYKGTIERVYVSSGRIVLKDTYVYANKGWEERERRKTFELDPGTPIYYGGKLVDTEDVQNNYLNFEGYVAVSNNFNSEKAVKVVLKKGYEKQYSDRIDEISWGTGELELDDKNNILFNDGTIILSQKRMVDMTALEEGHTITTVVDRYGGYNNAVLVVREDAISIGEKIYVGRLNEIRTGQFDMNYYSCLEDNEWDKISKRSDDITFYYDDDTVILSVYGSDVREISAGDFFQGDYADDSSYKSDEDYYAYVIVEDERAKAIRITKGGIVENGAAIGNDDLEELRITTGEVKEIDNTLNIITLNKASNWTSFYNEWERGDDEMYVNYSKAIIFRDGRSIDAGQLRSGESVYVIRDDNRGIIILVL